MSRIRLQLDALGQDILDILLSEIALTEESATGEIYLDGMANVLSEPEFAESDEARQALRVFEERSLLENLLSSTMADTDVGGSPGSDRRRGYLGRIAAVFRRPGSLRRPEHTDRLGRRAGTDPHAL